MNRTNPYEMMEQFFERMGQEFEQFSHGDTRRGMLATGDDLSMDVADREDAFEITVDVPGFDRDEIDVRLADDRVIVTAEHEHESESDAGTFIHRERAHRSLSRSIELPTPVDESAVEAKLTNGVLTITLPKVERDEDRSGIEIDVE